MLKSLSQLGGQYGLAVLCYVSAVEAWYGYVLRVTLLRVTANDIYMLCCAPEYRPRSCRVPTAAASRRRITRCRNVQRIARPAMSSVCAAAKRCTCPVR